MTHNRDIRIPDQSVDQINLLAKKHRYFAAYKRMWEAEICQKIEIESAFQARLVTALDKEGCFVTNVETKEERGSESIREKHEREPECTIYSWRCFRVHSKDAPDLFWLTVWLSGDKSSLPESFSSSKWRALSGDNRNLSGPSKTKELNGVSFIDSTLPFCCHLLIIDAQLRFETLPLPVVRDTLLDGHLAEELASKVAKAFDRINTKTALPDDGCAAAREAEIRQKIEIEIAFRHRLVAALDREGYIVKSVMKPENQGREFLREKYENEPDRSKRPCVFFFVHSKEAAASFCLGVWFSSDEPSQQSFNWRTLADVIGTGPSKGKEGDRASWREATQPVCYLQSVIDARLCFEALPIPVIQATLLDSQLAEELAAKVALIFDRIQHYEKKHFKGPVG